MKLGRIIGDKDRFIRSLLLIATILYSLVCAQNLFSAPLKWQHVRGVVTDSITGERLGYVSIRDYQGHVKGTADANGYFDLVLPEGRAVTVAAIGYKPKSLLAVNPNDTLRFALTEESYQLDAILVKPKKQKYSKKNNPAVELIESLRATRHTSDPFEAPAYSYDFYEKMSLGVNDYKFDPEKYKKGLRGKLSFVGSLVDTAQFTGKQILTISLKEKLATRVARKDHNADKTIVSAIRSKGVDEAFNQDNVGQVLEDVIREIDVFDNDIVILQNRFVSPLSNIGPDYYKYFITDTIDIDGVKCVELTFSPHTPESFSFNGKLYIAHKDSIPYLKHLTMRMPKATNVNYVNSMTVEQEYELDSIGNRHKVVDDMGVELQIVSGTPAIYVQRNNRYENFSYEPRHDYTEEYLDKIGSVFVIDEAPNQNPDFWNEVRMVPLTHAQDQMGGFMQRIRKIPVLYWTEKVLLTIINGYITTGHKSKFDFGPVNTFISKNGTEGWRFRVGGITTGNLSKRIFSRAYVAYGLGDKKLKYNVELEYSFNDKKYHSREFPMNAIRATYLYDVDALGQHYLYTNADNFLMSFKRKSVNLSTYQRLAQLEYNLELRNHLSFNIAARHEMQESTPFVPFIDINGQPVRHYTTTGVRATIRFAPGEKFMQRVGGRQLINFDAPVFVLRQDFAPKGFMGTDFTLNKTELLVQNRFWFSAFGYLDFMVKGAKIWSQVQFPALLWQNANLSYIMTPEAYVLLNPMEFAMDKYASVDMTYFANGALFNRIPLIKKLKLREVVTFKGFVGSLSKKNNPAYNDNLYRFPEIANTTPMGKTPYMELGVGIDNILTILRVDYVWRLTYRDRPDISKSGIRISAHFSF